LISDSDSDKELLAREVEKVATVVVYLILSETDIVAESSMPLLNNNRIFLTQNVPHTFETKHELRFVVSL
jgi:hypothetical protein